MTRLTAGVFVVLSLPLPLWAQERDRALERISLALQQPTPLVSSADPGEALRLSTLRTFGVPIFEPLPGGLKLGPFTFGTPQLRGEIIRVSLPVGEYVTRGARGFAAANRRRQEKAARRRIEAELKALAERPPPQQ